jgi:hypothetical protein
MDGLAMTKRLLELAHEVPDEQAELRDQITEAALIAFAYYQAASPRLEAALAEAEAEMAAGFPNALPAGEFIAHARAVADELRQRAAG